jgi:cellulose synthase (UDP-forming)
MSNDLYFLDPKYEARTPPLAQSQPQWMQNLFQFFATVTLVLGLWYLHFRWTASLNMEALWFALPLAFAETMMFIGTLLVMINFWRIEDTPTQAPPRSLEEVGEEHRSDEKIAIDIYVPVFNEDPQLVRQTIRASKAVRKLDSWVVSVYLLDDSKNPAMTKMAQEEGIEQITREGKKGRKAGAITKAIDRTGGDFIVIIDSDTRLFPDILLNTMGYFKDPLVAWVQTPQWFCDLTTGEEGEDIFANDPSMFFDVIQRRRNNYNASFCCGATSIHRVEALKEVAYARYKERIAKAKAKGESIEDIDVEYIVYHASEDIYTSLTIHAYQKRRFKSILHPQVESKMLSPLDLGTWITQRFRYAGGSIDMIKREFKRFFTKGLSLGQKLMYFSTFWSYTGAIWMMVLLLAPIIYMFTNIAPVDSYSLTFFIHLVPFLFFNQLALMIATWGIDANRGSAFFVAISPLVIKAFIDVARNKPINFVVTSKVAQSGSYLSLVKVQIGLIGLYLLAILFASVMLLIGERIYYTGFAVNVLWSIYNVVALWAIVRASRYKFQG